MWMRRRSKEHRLSKPPNFPTPPASSKETGSSSPIKGQLCRQFTISEIRSATQKFNERFLIGQGGFGNVYKGTINNGTIMTVAFKRWRWNSDSGQGAAQFQMEVDLLPMLQHPNIVCLIGYCTGSKEMILVYEYMSNGSLGDHLHKHHTPLSWPQRLKICIDVARGLEYLHNGTSGQEVIHRNVTSSDILLDNQWAAKIGDFGLSKIIPDDFPSTHVSTRVAGTLGYIDPEYLVTGRLSKKSDVYSFGVVLLEVLCRRRAIDMNLDEEQRALVRWAQDCIRNGNLEQIIDPDLKGQTSLKCLNDYARIVKCCLREHQEHRVTMAQVVFGLESILALHETTDDSIPQMSITTSDRRLQDYFFSSVGSYFRKDTELLSANSSEHEGDDGDMPEKDFEKPYERVMSPQKSGYERVMSPQKSGYCSSEEIDPGSEPNSGLIDGELLSEDQTESLYELMRLEYIQRADVLMRMKDFLHLIWSYPVKKEAQVDFGSLVDKCSSLNEYIRKSMDSSRDGHYLTEIQTLVQDLEEDLNDAAFDMVAYLPQDNSMQVSFERFWSDVPQVHASAIASATHRAISCIKDLKVKKLGISGSGAEQVAERLKEMTELRSAFDIVVCVSVKHHNIQELMSDIEEEIHRLRKRSSNKITVMDQNCMLFIDCSEEEYIDLHGHEFNLSKWFGNVQIVMTSGSQNAYCPVDMEMRVTFHLLPWILFSTNVGQAMVGNNSRIQQMATRVIEKCHGHLLAIVLLARSLRGVVDVSVWELALEELASQEKKPSSCSSSQLDVMVRVLTFIWSRMEFLTQRCIIQFVSHCTQEESSLINSWIKDGLVKSEQEGEHVIEDLIRSYLVERVVGNYVGMRDEIRVILRAYFVPRAYGLYLKQDGSGSNVMPKVEEWDAREIHLSNNIVSVLPDNPDCPLLVNLFLHSNQDLTDIPITFFDNMPTLQVLNLSSTSIRCLPSSISKLTTLRKLFIRDCDLMMELPPEIGTLKSLKVFDSEGTQLVSLPKEIGSLIKLECFKFSLYSFADKHKPSNQIVPVADLAKLRRLKQLSIYVDSYGEWWEDEVKSVIDTLAKLRNLESLRLYFPTTELLEMFMETHNWRGFPIYQHLSDFGFVVGRLQERRLISRVPRELLKMFIKLLKCLMYTNGEGDTKVIPRVLKHVDAFFLDRHWTVRSLSAFGLLEMEKLKFCLLAECNQMLEIVHFKDYSPTPVLGSLKHLSVHYMKSLTCIFKGPGDSACLSNLKTLAIHSCPRLITIFTQGFLDNLTCLEYLIVEDCSMIDSLVSLESYHYSSTPCLPSLKKIALLHLPQLVSISRGISIAPRLQSLVVYDCPKLEQLPYMEASDDLREIKGDNEWWDALKWCEPEWTSGQPDYLPRIFVPLGTNGDIMDELADAVNLLPHLGD